MCYACYSKIRRVYNFDPIFWGKSIVFQQIPVTSEEMLWVSMSWFCMPRAGTSHFSNADCIKYAVVVFQALFREWAWFKGNSYFIGEKWSCCGKYSTHEKIQQELKINLWLNELAF